MAQAKPVWLDWLSMVVVVQPGDVGLEALSSVTLALSPFSSGPGSWLSRRWLSWCAGQQLPGAPEGRGGSRPSWCLPAGQAVRAEEVARQGIL